MSRISMQDIGVAIGGVAVQAGGGEGDFISITSPTQMGTKTGVHGEVIHHDTPNNVYEVTLTLLENSAVNVAIASVRAAQRLSSLTGTFNVTLNNRVTGFRLSGQASIVKEPDVKMTAEAQNFEWMLHLESKEGIQYQTAVPIVP